MTGAVKPTPGPWKAQRTDGPRPDWRVVAASKRGRLATVHGGEAEINARLIASAPDLLAALKRISDMCPATQEMSVAHMMADEADAAISKAEGEHQ